ncbi:MAG: DUF2934 domain-containing protein [Alphaproteobacteria bacterium]|nr:DUF2934 domain-containing protein [Alphaproteobacteria bacterium]MBV8407913.1 DUF2934 domain-containing protein [Alphaproteobacteria bacterium]
MTPANAAPCTIEAVHTAIAERAYTLWESEGKPEGRDVEHWSQAEAEIMASSSLPGAQRPQGLTAGPRLQHAGSFVPQGVGYLPRT